MPAPDVFVQGEWDPFTDRNPIEDIPYGGVLFATDRKPSQEEGQFYLNDRGHVLRLGVAKVSVGKESMTWEEARRISLLKERPDDYPLKVTSVKETAILDDSINMLTGIPPGRNNQGTQEDFADQINAKLAISKVKDIFIYVHGYKVEFTNPLLVTSELWHFFGYEGVFIAYAWPSTPKTTAYFSDLETAALSARNLRLLLQFLAENTDARRIHLIGYSAGTRVVAAALYQLALLHSKQNCTRPEENLRIGHAVFAGSDIDLNMFGAYMVDGILDITENVTVYASLKDMALGASGWFFGRKRIGQIVGVKLNENAIRFLKENRNLVIVDATNARGADTGNGHAYFRKSPEISSDILTMLRFNLKPEERGLEQSKEQPTWIVPEDYIERLRKALKNL